VLAVGGHVLSDLDPQCVRMTTGFAGGVGGTHQEMCGALSGGVLVIGALLGRATLDESDQAALALATDYRERFRADFGHTVCAQIREIVHAPSGLGSCAVLVQQAAIILLEMLEER
jgi:C_GCAxxG_C_C family probable redox protein